MGPCAYKANSLPLSYIPNCGRYWLNNICGTNELETKPKPLPPKFPNIVFYESIILLSLRASSVADLKEGLLFFALRCICPSPQSKYNFKRNFRKTGIYFLHHTRNLEREEPGDRQEACLTICISGATSFHFILLRMWLSPSCVVTDWPSHFSLQSVYSPRSKKSEAAEGTALVLGKQKLRALVTFHVDVSVQSCAICMENRVACATAS